MTLRTECCRGRQIAHPRKRYELLPRTDVPHPGRRIAGCRKDSLTVRTELDGVHVHRVPPKPSDFLARSEIPEPGRIVFEEISDLRRSASASENVAAVRTEGDGADGVRVPLKSPEFRACS